jgi:predicted transcriptional regulator
LGFPDTMKQQAKEMYFQSGLTKTEIAEKLGVSRRTVYQWSADGNWDKLRQSARNMPVVLAEKVYYLIGHLTDQMLQREPLDPIVTEREVNMLARLTNIVGKLRKGCTVSENMETFTYFLERMMSKDPGLAERVQPYVEEYIEARRGKSERDFLLAGFNENGTLPIAEKELFDKWDDEKEEEDIRKEKESKVTPTPAPKQTSAPTVEANPSTQPTGVQKVGSAQAGATSPKPAPKQVFSHYRTPEKKRELVAA